MKWNIKKFSDLTNIELYTILKERTQVFVVEQECPYLEVDGKDIASYHLTVENDEEMIAYLRILPSGVAYSEASLGRILVKKEYRGHKLAKELINRGLDFLKVELKETSVKIQAQSYLLKFYRSFGFEAVSEEYLEDNIPHIDMVLLLMERD